MVNPWSYLTFRNKVKDNGPALESEKEQVKAYMERRKNIVPRKNMGNITNKLGTQNVYWIGIH